MAVDKPVGRWQRSTNLTLLWAVLSARVLRGQVLYGLTGSSNGSVRRHGLECVELVVVNRREEDVPMRPHLKALADHDNGVNVSFVLSSPPDGWTGGHHGHVRREIIEPLLLPPSDAREGGASTASSLASVRLLWCGPGPFNQTVEAVAEDLHVPPGSCHAFY